MKPSGQSAATTLAVLGLLLAVPAAATAQERDLDAAFRDGNKVYFFKGEFVIRFDVEANRADEGFPKRILEVWPGLPKDWSRIGAAMNLGETQNRGGGGERPPGTEGVVCLFRGKEFLKFHLRENRVVEGPKPIGGNLNGSRGAVPFDEIQAAFDSPWPALLFSGNRYVHVDSEFNMYTHGANSMKLAGPNRPYLGNWREVELDAAVGFPDGRAFFFKGDQVTRMTTVKRGDHVTGKILEKDFPGLRFGLCGTWRNSYGEDIEVYQKGDAIAARMLSPSGRLRWVEGEGREADGKVALRRGGPNRTPDGEELPGNVNDKFDRVEWVDGDVWQRVPFEFSGIWEDGDGRKIVVEGPVRQSPASGAYSVQFVMLDPTAGQGWNSGSASTVLDGSGSGRLSATINVNFTKVFRRGFFSGTEKIEWAPGRPGDRPDLGTHWTRVEDDGELWRESDTGGFIWLKSDGAGLHARRLSPGGAGAWSSANTAQEGAGGQNSGGGRPLQWDFKGGAAGAGAGRRESLITDDARMVWKDGTFWYRVRTYTVLWEMKSGMEGILSAVISGTRGITDKIILNDYLSGIPGRVPMGDGAVSMATVLAPDIGDFDRLILGIDREATGRRFANSEAEFARIMVGDLSCELGYVKLLHRPGIEIWDEDFRLHSVAGTPVELKRGGGSIALDSRTPPRPEPGKEGTVDILGEGRGLASVEVMEGGRKVRYHLFPDNHDPYLWYYAPQDLRLVEREIRGQRWPELSFLWYQKGVPADAPSRLVSGAELNFALQIATGEADVVESLKAELLNRSATMRYLTGRAPWAYVLDWPGAFALTGNAWEPRFLALDPVLAGLGDFQNAFAFSRPARSALQGQKALRSLELLPLPVTETEVELTVAEGTAPIKSGRTRDADLQAESIRAVRKFPQARFLADLGGQNGAGTGAGPGISRRPEIVEAALAGEVGILTRATLGFQRADGKSGYGSHIFDLDPGQVVSDWLDGLAVRLDALGKGRTGEVAEPVTATEAALVRVLEEEWLRALEAGYFPENRGEGMKWSRLMGQIAGVTPVPDSYDFETLYRHRYLRFAVYYLLWIAMDEGDREVDVAGDEARRTRVRGYLRLRREEGANFLNFMTYPKYRAGYRNLVAKEPLLGDQELAWQAPIQDMLENVALTGLFPDPASDPAFRKRQVLEEAVRLFEGRGGAAATRAAAAGPTFQDPAYVELPPTFLNLNRYPDEMVESLFGFQRDPIRPGALVLPDLEIDGWLGCEEVDIQTTLEFDDPTGQIIADRFREKIETGGVADDGTTLLPKEVEVQEVEGGSRVKVNYPVVTWSDKRGWTGRKSAVQRFGLPGLDPEFGEFLVANRAFLGSRYRVHYRLAHAGGDLEFEVVVPVFQGTRSLPGLDGHADLARVNFELLDWKGVTPGGELSSVELSLSQGDRRFEATVLPVRGEDGKLHAPSELTWLVEGSRGGRGGEVSVKAVFVAADGRRRATTQNVVIEELDTLFLQSQ